MARYRSRAQQQSPEEQEFEEKVVRISRVSKKTKGGNKMSFSALLVVGDRKGRVGVALGKAPDTLSAIRKGVRRAKKRMTKIPMKGTTVPFQLIAKRGAAKVMLKPAPPGTGVIAGGAVRAVMEAGGVRDIVAKILGSSNKASNVYATFEALKQMNRIANRHRSRKLKKQEENGKKTSPGKKETRQKENVQRDSKKKKGRG